MSAPNGLPYEESVEREPDIDAIEEGRKEFEAQKEPTEKTTGTCDCFTENTEIEKHSEDYVE